MTDSKRFARKGSVPRLTDTGRARRDADDATLLRIQLAENTKRTDITAIELANAYVRLMALEKPLGKTQKQVAEEVGTTQARFSKYLALSKAPEEYPKSLIRRWPPRPRSPLQSSKKPTTPTPRLRPPC